MQKNNNKKYVFFYIELGIMIMRYIAGKKLFQGFEKFQILHQGFLILKVKEKFMTHVIVALLSLHGFQLTHTQYAMPRVKEMRRS